MTLNILGWAGLTVVGTAITLLPTILHVRAPTLRGLLLTPWLMFGGLTLFVLGIAIDRNWLGAAGMVSYTAGLVTL